MFDTLSERLTKTLKRLRGNGRLTEADITKALKDVKNTLLEADVALSVVTDFTNKVRKRALGREVLKSLSPGQTIVKIVKQEMQLLMGEKNEALNLKAQPPVVIVLAGLQGSGKTTTAAKLAKWLKEVQKKHVLLVSCDIYRPAAIDQLHTLARDIHVNCFETNSKDQPVHIVQQALQQAKETVQDVLIIDTAGRLHVDENMMQEIQSICEAVSPTETLFVVDSMTGQDAANTAKAFNDVLPLTGIILTKVDGDARGGAAFSVREITGKPIKFLGSGEKTEALEPFHPERLVSRILGMGDMLSLIEQVEQRVDKEKADELATKIKKGQTFTLIDFKEQLLQMNRAGGLQSLAMKLPGMSNLSDQMKSQLDDKKTVRMAAIIDSMTPQERKKPEIISTSRKRRVAGGAGVEVVEVNKLLKQFEQMQKMMKKMGDQGKMMQMMRNLQNRMNMTGMGGL